MRLGDACMEVLGKIFLATVCSFIVMELRGFCSQAAKWLVRKTAADLPDWMRDSFIEENCADLDAIDGPVSKLYNASHLYANKSEIIMLWRVQKTLGALNIGQLDAQETFTDCGNYLEFSAKIYLVEALGLQKTSVDSVYLDPVSNTPIYIEAKLSNQEQVNKYIKIITKTVMNLRAAQPGK